MDESIRKTKLKMQNEIVKDFNKTLKKGMSSFYTSSFVVESRRWLDVFGACSSVSFVTYFPSSTTGGGNRRLVSLVKIKQPGLWFVDIVGIVMKTGKNLFHLELWTSHLIPHGKRLVLHIEIDLLEGEVLERGHPASGSFEFKEIGNVSSWCSSEGAMVRSFDEGVLKQFHDSLRFRLGLLEILVDFVSEVSVFSMVGRIVYEF
ncbi:hypothetical protein Tco_0311907 [Tanacetum coccineum]